MTPRRVLLTGVSQGLGEALAIGLIQAGHSVAGCSRNIPNLDDSSTSTSALVDAFHASKTSLLDSVDLTDDAAVRAWIKDVLTDWGTPNLVINNAGVINKNCALWDVPLDEFEQVIAVNVTGVFSVIRHILPAMIQTGEGVIANISSGWGRTVAAEVAPYCASKWGIEGLTLALAEDLPDGLAAVPVNPGVINTAMLQSCFGPTASNAPTPSQWAKRAVPFFLGLNARDNGSSLSV